jgi:hypothetical protein
MRTALGQPRTPPLNPYEIKVQVMPDRVLQRQPVPQGQHGMPPRHSNGIHRAGPGDVQPGAEVCDGNWGRQDVCRRRGTRHAGWQLCSCSGSAQPPCALAASCAELAAELPCNTRIGACWFLPGLWPPLTMTMPFCVSLPPAANPVQLLRGRDTQPVPERASLSPAACCSRRQAPQLPPAP